MVVPILGLVETGGWKGMTDRIAHSFPANDHTHLWSTLGSFNGQPDGHPLDRNRPWPRVCNLFRILDNGFLVGANAC